MGESGAFFFLFLITFTLLETVPQLDLKSFAPCTFPHSDDNRQFALIPGFALIIFRTVQ